jgi:hypothetical protein
MVLIASPAYRLRGPGPGLFQYGLDSIALAVHIPGMIFLPFLESRFLQTALLVVIWGYAIWPLTRPRTKKWLTISYVTLVVLWTLYAIGWPIAHLNFGA